MPGTYLAGEPVVTIAAFAPQLHVITSKQRPRKLTIHGSDGAEYQFLLKVRLPGSHACRVSGLLAFVGAAQWCNHCVCSSLTAAGQQLSPPADTLPSCMLAQAVLQ